MLNCRCDVLGNFILPQLQPGFEGKHSLQMTLIEFNSKDHPEHWDSQAALPQVLRFVLFNLV